MKWAVFVGCLLASACVDDDGDHADDGTDRPDGAGGSNADATGEGAAGALAPCSFDGSGFRSFWLETYEWGEFEGPATVISVGFERLELGVDWEGFEADSLVRVKPAQRRSTRITLARRRSASSTTTGS